MPYEGSDFDEMYSAIEQSYLPGDEDARAEYEAALERAQAALGDARLELEDAFGAYLAAAQRAAATFGIALGLAEAGLILGGGR